MMKIDVFARTKADADRGDRIYLANSQMLGVSDTITSGDVIGRIHVKTFQRDGGAIVNNRYVVPEKAGVVIVIDDQSDVLESRGEAEALIEQIRKAAEELWPK